MDSIFMKSGNNEIPDTHTLLLNLTDKINLKRGDKYVAISNISMCYTYKNIKRSCKYNK